MGIGKNAGISSLSMASHNPLFINEFFHQESASALYMSMGHGQESPNQHVLFILTNSADIDLMRYFIWVYTVCQSTHLGVSSIQRVTTTQLAGYES